MHDMQPLSTGQQEVDSGKDSSISLNLPLAVSHLQLAPVTRRRVEAGVNADTRALLQHATEDLSLGSGTPIILAKFPQETQPSTDHRMAAGRATYAQAVSSTATVQDLSPSPPANPSLDQTQQTGDPNTDDRNVDRGLTSASINNIDTQGGIFKSKFEVLPFNHGTGGAVQSPRRNPGLGPPPNGSLRLHQSAPSLLYFRSFYTLESRIIPGMVFQSSICPSSDDRVNPADSPEQDSLTRPALTSTLPPTPSPGHGRQNTPSGMQLPIANPSLHISDSATLWSYHPSRPAVTSLPNLFNASSPGYLSPNTSSQLPALQATPSAARSVFDISAQIPLPLSSPTEPGPVDTSSLSERQNHSTASTSFESVIETSSPTPRSHPTPTQVPFPPAIASHLRSSRRTAQPSQSIQSSPIVTGIPVSILLGRPAPDIPSDLRPATFYNTHLMPYVGGTPNHRAGATTQQETDEPLPSGAILNPNAAPFVPGLRPQTSSQLASAMPFTSIIGHEREDDTAGGDHAKLLPPSDLHAQGTPSTNTKSTMTLF